MKLQSGKAASAVMYDKHMQVDRRDAVKIVKKFKAAGLAHGVIGHPEEFVRHGFQAAHEEAHETVAQANQPKTEIVDAKKAAMIKRQNLAMHAKSIADEKAKEAAAQQAGPAAKSTAQSSAVQLAKQPIASIQHRSPADRDTAADTADQSPQPSLVNALQPTKTTQTEAAATPTPPATAGKIQGQETSQEVIDLAID